MNYVRFYDNVKFIDQELKKGKYPNSTSLGERLGWKDRKTILRIIQTMKEEFNAPIEYDDHKKGYYYTDKNFTLINTFLPKREAMVLKILEGFIKDEFGDTFFVNFHDMVERILPGIKEKDDNEYFMELESNLSFSPSPKAFLHGDILFDIIDAIYFDEKIKIDYRSQKDEVMERTVHPYKIIYKNSVWYIIAYCELRKKVQLFALHNIISIQVLEEETFTRPDKIDLKIGHGIDSLSGGGDYEVVIKIFPEAACYVRDRYWHNTQKITENKDKSINISFRVNTLNNVKRWLLGFGGNAKVLSPLKLKAMMKKDAQDILGRYSRGIKTTKK
jgi:predicted DNA-binding transcriptional regulator YafY